ncbi:hypothetical protein N7490_003127 [Penicillium lividum]|nr:hypothetical protein N7490_003127 [Penicillium lividum]
MASSLPDLDTMTPKLFQNSKFWVSYHVPQRTKIQKMIKDNGGVITLREQEADINIVDHTKKNLPDNAYSYQYVERSVRNGKLEDLEPYLAGPSAQRSVGASHIPKKGTRTEYTLKDDQILYDWLHHYQQEDNAKVGGNNIYKELAEKFPRHTWQSWRARYINKISGKPRPGGGEPEPDLLSKPQLQLRHATGPASKPRTVPPRSLAAAEKPNPSRPLQSGRRDPDQLHEAIPAPKRTTIPSHTPAAKQLNPSKSPESRRRDPDLDHVVVPSPKSKTVPSPIPAAARQLNLSISPELQSSDPRHVKRKRESTGESTSSLREMEMFSAKKRLIGTSEAMDSMAHNISHKNRPVPAGSPSKLSSQLTSPATPSRISRPSLPLKETEPKQNQAAHNRNGTSNSKLLETPIPPVSEPKQNQATRPQDETNLINMLLLEMPFLPSSPEPESDEDEYEDDLEIHPDIDSWIDARLARGDVELPIVLEALQCTSMNPEFAEKVLEQCAAGKGIPHDMPGVWTAEDDKRLEGEDQRDIQSLFDKHGEDACEARFEFLDLMRS